MFERFTDRARQSIVEAQTEAVEQQVNFIGSEHLLLGLVRVGSGVAYDVLTDDGVEIQVLREKVIARLGEIVDPDRQAVSKADALAAIGIDLGSVKASVEATFGPGSLPDLGSTPAFTPRAKAALTGSLRRAQGLRQRFIGTEHVLLGLLDDHETYACLSLDDLGVDLDRLDRRVTEMVAPAEARVDAAWQAITQLHVLVGRLPDADRERAAGVLATLSSTLGRSLGDEQAEVTRVANQTAEVLERALATASEELGRPT